MRLKFVSLALAWAFGTMEEHGDVAQLGEHCLCKAGVAGSIPVVSTLFQEPLQVMAGIAITWKCSWGYLDFFSDE